MSEERIYELIAAIEKNEISEQEVDAIFQESINKPSATSLFIATWDEE